MLNSLSILFTCGLLLFVLWRAVKIELERRRAGKRERDRRD